MSKSSAASLDPVQHQHVVGDGVADVRVEPDRGGNAADELRAQ